LLELLRLDELRPDPLLDLLLLERVPLAPILLLELPLPVFFVGILFSIQSPRLRLKRSAATSFPV
jgi:hypothetical protein